MGQAHKRYLEEAATLPATGAEQAAWIAIQTSAGTPALLTSAHFFPCANDLSVQLEAARVEDDSRKGGGTRSPRPSYSDRFPLGALQLEANLYPPATLAGTSNLLGSAVLDALFARNGAAVNGQIAVNVDTLTSHDQASTVIVVVGTVALYPVGTVIALISNNASSAGAAGIQRVITASSDAGGGNVNITVKSGWPGRPVATGTKDQIRGGYYWYADDAVRFGSRLFTLGVKSGRSGFLCYDGTFGKGGLTFTPSGLLKFSGEFNFTRILRASEDQIRGDATTAAFTTTDTVLRVPGTNKIDVDMFVTLKRVTTSDAWANSAVVTTETKVKVTARNTSTRQITITRAATPVSATALAAVTAVIGQERDGPYDTQVTNILRIAIDHRPYLDVTLTSGAARTAAQIVTDINNALKAGRYYGQYADSPGHNDIDWESVASANGVGVRLTSPLWGSQSRIQVIDTGNATTSAHAIIFEAAFDIGVTEEIQVEPWAPAGSTALAPILQREGASYIDGGAIGETEAKLDYDSAIEGFERRDNTQYMAGIVPDLNRKLGASITVPAVGAFDDTDQRAIANTTHVINMQGGVAVGLTVGVHFIKARVGSGSKSGDKLQSLTFPVYPEEDTTLVIKEAIVALT